MASAVLRLSRNILTSGQKFQRTINKRDLQKLATGQIPSRASYKNKKCISHIRYHLPRRTLQTSSCYHGEIVQFNLADIGEGIAQVHITEWYVNVGDKVEQFDQICEVKSDKASVTITSRFNGTVKKLYYDVDDEANVGSPIVDIELEGSDVGEKTAEEVIAEPEPILNEASAKETLPPPPLPPVSDPSPSLSPPSPPPDAHTQTWQSTSTTQRKVVPAAPAVRKMAKENHINLEDVIATGKDGRVLKEDVLRYLSNKERSEDRIEEVAPSVSVTPPPMPVVPVVAAEDRIEPIKGIKKAMVTSMINSLQVPHAGFADEVEMSELIRVRESLKSLCKERGVKLSFMPFFIKAASMAMMQYPIINSSIDLDKMQIVYKASHNIGYAMDTKEGLLVPNVKDVQLKSVFEIATEMERIGQLGKEGKLGMNDLTGGTFTISNIGSIGGTYVRAIVNPPEVAICALGQVQKLPRFNEAGNVNGANIMNASWSLDHRVIDGATMARYSNLWKSYLENPSRMVMDLK